MINGMFTGTCSCRIHRPAIFIGDCSPLGRCRPNEAFNDHLQFREGSIMIPFTPQSFGMLHE